MALSPGTRLGPYEILGAAGAGGMGEVYRARDTRLDRTVAIKVLPGSLSSNCDFRARFKQEAKAISSLSHTHICTLYDIGEQDGIDYLVLEYLEGATLSDRLMRSKMENSEILRIGIQVADALKAAHAKGIVHRDIKPANVFLTKDGEVKVLDFGVARMGALVANASNEATSMTIAGETMGTVAYMSPEQARGKVTDARSDLFSLGAVIYEMATGARPFPGDTTAEVFDGILNKMPVPISRISPITPVELDRIVTKALEKDPDLRFQSAADLASELKRLNRDASSSAVVTPAVAGKSRTGAWVGIGVVLIAVVAGAVWWMMRDRSGSTAGSGGQVTVAVLPFQNMGAGSDMDFMRVALADEITTALSYAPQLAIRPSSSVRKYLEGDVDPQKAGKELRVTNLVTGHFLKNRDDLQVTLEAINVENNLVVWRETSSFPMSDMKSLQERVLARVRQGLLPMLGVSSTSGPKTEAHNEEAYNLYLKALAMPHDPGPNQQAIALLEKSVALESTYAPAWAWLGQRYDYAATYEGGGRAMQDKCKEALERAVRLDPNLLWAAGGLVQLLSDRGELEPALAQAQEFVKAHPDVAEAHFSLSYVLRYTGMLDRSQKECATVLKLDPTNYRWRSCAQAFCSANDYEGAEPYLALDAGSWWVRRVREQILLKQGRRSEAMAMANDQSDAWARFESASLRGAPSSEVEKLAEDYEAWLMKINDSEMLYNGAAYLAYGNQRAAALRVLKSAVDGNYCQYPAMDNDPMLANIRNTPEYAALRDKAKACHERMVVLAK